MSSIPNPITPEYLAESHSGRILAAAIPCTIIATTAVALRFTARLQVKAKIWWDDYTIFFALMFLYPFNILLMVDAEIWGLGRHIPYLDEIQIVKFLKVELTLGSILQNAELTEEWIGSAHSPTDVLLPTSCHQDIAAPALLSYLWCHQTLSMGHIRCWGHRAYVVGGTFLRGRIRMRACGGLLG